MSVSIGRAITEVVPAPEKPSPSPQGGESQQTREDRLRRALAGAAILADRTRAEGFDD
jgi:hypothetical protein